MKRPVWALHVFVVGLALHNFVMAELWDAGLHGRSLEIVSAWMARLSAELVRLARTRLRRRGGGVGAAAAGLARRLGDPSRRPVGTAARSGSGGRVSPRPRACALGARAAAHRRD